MEHQDPSPPDAVPDEAEPTPEDGRHATNLELFLDLAFVFGVSQIATLLAGDLTLAGFGRGLLVALLVWWLWSQFAWLGTAVDVQDRRPVRLVVLAVVPVVLLLAVAIPTAYTTGGRQFGVAYLMVLAWALAVQGWTAWGDEATRRAWLLYAPAAAVAPALVAVGGFASGAVRTGCWVVAAALMAAAALAAGRQREDTPREWRVDPTHFAERHALFVIIVLGEVLVACGVASSGIELTAAVAAGIVACVGLACVFWWAYFGFVAGAAEAALRRAPAVDRGRVARDLFTFGHFPLVAGVALFSIVARATVPSPSRHLDDAHLVVLAVSVVAFVGAMMALHWRVVRGVAVERAVLIVAVVVWCTVAGPVLAGAVVVAGVGLGLLVMHLVTLRFQTRRYPVPVSAPPP
jgi:low temperature requirement protein LtrA